MKIGIFSKFDMAGGSEFRATELANAVARHSSHDAYLLAEKKIPEKIEKYLEPSVKVFKHLFSSDDPIYEVLYELDTLLIINTDCKSFTLADYWLGKSERHGKEVDLRKMKQMVFLFNFLISPSRHLYSIERYCKDIRIITTNTKFFNEVSSQDRYELVRHLPRTILQSPINPDLYDTTKTESSAIRFGMHSKGPENKWNDELPKLIEKCKDRLGDKIQFDFMGMNSKRAKEVKSSNGTVQIRKEDEVSVKEYLTGIDVFTFFPSWSREEPWARVVGEAMMSGCPVLATKKGGNLDQIVHGNNGFLCKSWNDFFKNIVQLTESPEKIQQLSRNSLLLARNFASQKVIQKLLEFIKD
tara:strand:- start:191 stop:1258 length:1068 start_codon:yes stop_codon:yes gene_type:complete